MKETVLLFSITIIVFGCSVSSKAPRATDLLNEIHKSQKQYYSIVLKQNPDYFSLLTFSNEGRKKLYKDNKVELANYNDFIILEGYNNAWGGYVGFLFSESGDWLYQRSGNTPWRVKKVDLGEAGLETSTGIAPEILRTVKAGIRPISIA